MIYLKKYKIFETMIGSIVDYSGKGRYEIYKNPENLTNLAQDLRGIIDESGNLFVVNNDGYDVLHNDIFYYLMVNDQLPFKDNDALNYIDYVYTKIVPVRRFRDSNFFFLNSCYSDMVNANKDNLARFFYKAKQLNPYLFFTLETFEEQEEKENRYKSELSKFRN